MVDRKAHPCMHKPNCIRLAVALAWRFHSVHNLRRERKTKKRVGESTICIRVEKFFWSGSRSIGRPTSVLISTLIESQPPRKKHRMDQRRTGHESSWRRRTSFTGVRTGDSKQVDDDRDPVTTPGAWLLSPSKCKMGYS